MAEAEADPYLDGQDEETKKRLADTNMENYGGKEHRDKQKAIADKQKEWDNCGQEVGVEVWRIEKFKVVKQKDFDGKFYGGDSYIVLNTYKPDPEKELLNYNAHFWLGEHTSQDEAGAAAIKTVELDDKLGDLPVQYREVQGHESKHFLGLWSDGIQILEGGVDSGFKKVKPEEYKPRLLHIRKEKGKRKKAVIREVPFSADSLHTGDAFFLDAGLKLFCYWPNGTSPQEKRASNEYMNKIFSERKGRPSKCQVDEGDDTPAHAEFWQILNDGVVIDPLPEGPSAKDRKAKKEKMYDDHVNKMFHVTDENGEMEIKEVGSGILDRGILQEEKDDVVIVDVGCVVFVWIGETSNRNELRSAMAHATEYLKKTGRPMWTSVRRVFDGREPEDFWKCFGVEKVTGIE